MNVIARFTAWRTRRLSTVLLLGLLALAALFSASPTVAQSPPAAPTNLTTTRSAGQIAVSWDAVTGATGYNVVVSQDGKQSWTRHATEQTSTSATITGIDHTLIYHVAVQAVNANGSSAWTTSDAIPPGDIIPGPLSGITATRTAGQIAVSWSPPDNANLAKSIGYDVNVSNDHKHSWTRHATEQSATNTTISSDNTLTWYVAVRAVTVGGWSGWATSGPIEANFLLLPAPASVSIPGRTTTSLAVSWSAVTNAQSYNINLSDDGGYSWTRVKSAASGTSFIVDSGDWSGFDFAATYIAAVQAVDSGVGGTWKNSAPSAPVFPPGPPASVTATRSGEGQVAVSWTPPADTGTYPIAAYDVNASSDAGGSWTRKATGSSGSSTTVSGIDNVSDYIFSVRATSAAGGGNWTNSAVVAGLDAPASASGYRGLDFIDVEWPHVSGATGYDINYSANVGASWTVAHSNVTGGDGATRTVRIAGLPNAGEYIVAVRARNQYGPGGWTNSAGVGFADFPLPVTNVTTSRVTSGELNVSWDTCDLTSDWCTGGSPITEYAVNLSTDGGVSWTRAKTVAVSDFTSGGAVTLTGVSDSTVYLVSVSMRSRVGGKWTNASAPAATTAQLRVPTNLNWTHTNNINNTITTDLFWEKPAGAGDTEAFSYEIECSASRSDLVWTYATCPPDVVSTANQHNSSWVEHASASDFSQARIRAADSTGTSLWVYFAPGPDQPAAIGAQYHDSALKVWWQRRSGQDATGGETGYDIQCTTSSSTPYTWTDCHSEPASLTSSFYVSPTTSGTVTNVRMRGRQGHRVSSWTAATSVPSSTPPVAPDNVAVDARTAAGATVTYTISWDKPSSPTGAVAYVVQCSADSQTSWSQCATVAATSNASLTATATRTTSQTAYTHIRVRADAGYLRGVWSTAVPTPLLIVSNLTSTSATLTLPGYTSAWSYKRTAGPSDTTCHSVTAGTNSATLSSLTADTFYEYTAYSGSGCTAANTLDAAHFSTTDYSVGNLGEAASATSCAVGHKNSAANQCAIAFSTGPVAGGYRLHSVSARFGAKTGSPGNISVAIHAANGGNPASAALVTLTGSNPDAAGVYTYSCSGEGCDLTANTTYFVVMSTNDTSGSKYYALDTTVWDAETKYPASNGWSIANTGRSKAGSNAWAALSSSRSPMLHVAAVTRPPMPATAVETNTVTLSLPNQTAQWYYKASAVAAAGQAGGSSANSCKGPVAAAGTATVTGLTGGRSYTISAYSDSGCTSANYIASTLAFTTLEEVTVSNLSVSDESPSNSKLRVADSSSNGALAAQAFTTGSAAAGYTLTSVVIDFHFARSGYVHTVTLREADDSNSLNPSSAVKATLSGDSPTNNIEYTYTCSGASCELDPNTTYFIHLQSTFPNWWSNPTVWQAKTSPNQTLLPSGNGWSLANSARYTEGSTVWYQYRNNNNPRPAALKVVAATKPKLVASKVLAASATLTLSSEFDAAYTGSWWLKRTSPASTTCTPKGRIATESVTGLTSGSPYTYKAYSDSACSTANEIAELTFTATSLNANEISGSGATLQVVGYTGTWYYKATTGPHNTCSSAVVASTIMAIDGLTPGTSYSYTAYSNSACTTASAIGSATFSTLSLAVVGITTTSATLDYTGSVTNWYYKANAGPDNTCQGPISGTSVTVTGLTRGTTYTYTVYSDSGCSTVSATAAAFTTAELSVGNLSETASANKPARLNWSGGARTNLANAFTTGDHSTGYTLTALTVDFGATVGSPGALSVEVWSDSSGQPGALQTTLSGSNPSSAGKYSFGCAQDCDVATGTYWLVMYTASGGASTNLYDPTWTASDGQTNAPSDAGWSIGDAASSSSGSSSPTWSAVSPAESVRFSVSANTRPALVVSNVQGATASLTLTNYDGSWHYKAVKGPDATCSTSAVTSGSTESLSGLTVGTSYTYAAYSDSACANQIVAAPAFTAIALTIGKLSNIDGELSIAGYTGDWYYKSDTAPDDTCSTDAVTGATEAISGLTKSTAYTYRAYSDSLCTAELSVLTFTTLASSLSASTTPTTATLTIGDHTGNWYVKRTSPSSGGCSSAAASDATQAVSSLTSVTAYVYHAYSDSNCRTAIARVAFITNPHPPDNVRVADHRVHWNRSSKAAAGVAIGYEAQYACAFIQPNWTHLTTEPETTSSGFSATPSCSFGLQGQVKAFKVVDGTRVDSTWNSTY